MVNKDEGWLVTSLDEQGVKSVRSGRQAHHEGKYKTIKRRLKDDPRLKTGC